VINDWLGDLMGYDLQGTDLVPTLATYLDLGGKYADTKRALSVHRNTLRYRLTRITEISGHDLADVDTGGWNRFRHNASTSFGRRYAPCFTARNDLTLVG